MSVTIRVPVVDVGIRVDRKLLIAPTMCAPPATDPQARIRLVPLMVTAILAVALTSWVWISYGAQHGCYTILGLLLGAALFHSRFGFASGFLQLVTVGNGHCMRAQALLLGTAASVIALICSTGAGLFGSVPSAVAYPIGLPLIIGAGVFAVGMQLAGSCASGTLFAIGTGQGPVLLTLGGFIVGGTFCTWAWPVLGELPQFNGILLAEHFGWLGSLAITITGLLAVVGVTRLVQRRRSPPPIQPIPTAHGIARIVRGTWPKLAGAVVVGALAGAVFLFAGGPWGAMSAFSLWGAKILQLFGLHPQTWEFWRSTAEASTLNAPVLTDQTSLTDFGIMIGAAAAAAAAGVWRLRSQLPWRTALAALLGGILMGIGSRMANGCNIGGLIGGISMGSVSGWIWALAALGGTMLGTRLRPLFGLINPRSNDSIC